jgi:hypothetical protein
MDLMNSRLKNFGFGSKRKSSAPLTTPQSSLQPPTPNGTSNTPPPGGNNSSSTSLPAARDSMNQNQLGRPPSYTYNPGARPTSPLPPGGQPAPQQAAHHPPPINTSGFPGGHPAQGMGAPAPPGYGGGYPQPGAAPHGAPHGLAQYGNRGPAVEVEGAGRSKAQLIVGIDFVSNRLVIFLFVRNRAKMMSPGHNLLWGSVRVRHQHRGEGRYYYGVARRWKSDKTESASCLPFSVGRYGGV